MIPFTIAAPGLLLDAPTLADVDDITRMCQDPVFQDYLTLPWPYTRSDALHYVTDFIPRGWRTGREFCWAIRVEEGGPMLGTISIRSPGHDVGFWLGAEHRGRGLMPFALRSVADWAFSTPWFVADRIVWECVLGNLASATVARKCGFSFLGEAPANTPARDGSRPPAWHGVLHSGDAREPKSGWPALVG